MFGVLDARLRQPLSRTRHERGGAAARSTHYRPSLLPRIAVPLLDVSHWRRDLKLQEQHLVLQFRSAHSQLTSLSLSPRIRGLLLLNLICAICGSQVAVVKEAQETLGPASFCFGRFSLSASLFLPFLPAALRSAPVRAAGLELGLLSAFAFAAQSWGLEMTSASHAAFLGGLTVVLIPLISGLTGTPIRRRTWVATAVAFAGIALLENGGDGEDGGGGAQAAGAAASWALGDAAQLCSAALFAAQLVRTEHHARGLLDDHAAGNGAHSASGDASDPTAAAASVLAHRTATTLQLVSVQLFTLAAFFGLLAAFSGSAQPHPPPLASLPWGAWAFTGCVATAGTLYAELVALRSDVSSPDAALVYATEPVWGAAAAASLLGERWGGAAWAGAALILAGSVYGQREGAAVSCAPGSGPTQDE